MTIEEQYKQFIFLSNAYYTARDDMRDKCKRVATILFGNKGNFDFKFYFETNKIEAFWFDYVDGVEEYAGTFAPKLLDKTKEEILASKSDAVQLLDDETRYKIYLEVKASLETDYA